MKKIIFGGASAALALIGFSAFKTANKTVTSYYWFNIASNDSKPITGSLGNVLSGDVTFVTNATTVSTSNTLCDKTNNYYCIIGFTANQVEASGTSSFVLKHASTKAVTTPTASGTVYVRSDK